MIRLTVPAIGEEEIAAVTEVLRSGHLVQGPRVAAFEQAVACQVEVQHAVAVSSGTAALHLALLSLGIGPGDLVVTTAYSWPATANVVELCGAQPVFVDIDPSTFNIDTDRLEDACRKLRADPSTSKRLRALLPVHAFGQPADMTVILEIADRYDVPVVEDAACALGARWNGRPAGSMGRLGCFSFHPRKAITTGEGGMITTNDSALADQLRALRNHGLDATAPRQEFILPGFNYRMTEMAGAIGLAQLQKLGALIHARQQQAAIYDRQFTRTRIRSPQKAAAASAVYQSYVVQIPDLASAGLNQVIHTLRAKGVETTIGTWHVPLTSFYRSRYEHKEGDFPAADSVFRRAVTLPLHPQLNESEQRHVVSELLNMFDYTPGHGLEAASSTRSVARDNAQ